MHVSRNHDIYMGGATGLVAIRESSLSYPPKIYDLELAHLYVNNKEITTGDQTGILNKSFAYTDRIKLNYLQNVCLTRVEAGEREPQGRQITFCILAVVR